MFVAVHERSSQCRRRKLRFLPYPNRIAVEDKDMASGSGCAFYSPFVRPSDHSFEASFFWEGIAGTTRIREMATKAAGSSTYGKKCRKREMTRLRSCCDNTFIRSAILFASS